MPKPLLNKTDVKTKSSIFNIEQKKIQTPSISKDYIDKILRSKRSKDYMACFNKLDNGNATMNQQKVAEILAGIANEFPEVQLSGFLLGYVSKCYLGDTYEVHTVNISGQIITHYKNGELLPDGMEKARSIAMNPAYIFIEVYTDCCRAISKSGLVSVVKD
jgi:hypothetical protein